MTILCLIAALCVLAVQAARPVMQLDEDAQHAAMLWQASLQELKDYRKTLGIPVDSTIDPTESGLIGVDYTDLTTTLGDLEAKQTSVNPAFAALTVMWLKKAGVKAGDPVAVSFSGSFPALNLGVLCACEVLNLRATIFSSVGASTYGANIPGYTWLDMEKHLVDQKLLTKHTKYASLGGIMDTGGGIEETGIALGEAAIARHGATYIREGTPRTVVTDTERRMKLYFENGTPKAFINVGGNVTSFGWIAEAALLSNGLLTSVPATKAPQRGVIFRMFEQGIPVIHLINIKRLAAENNLESAPKKIVQSPAQEGNAARAFSLSASKIPASVTGSSTVTNATDFNSTAGFSANGLQKRRHETLISLAILFAVWLGIGVLRKR